MLDLALHVRQDITVVHALPVMEPVYSVLVVTTINAPVVQMDTTCPAAPPAVPALEAVAIVVAQRPPAPPAFKATHGLELHALTALPAALFVLQPVPVLSACLDLY